jgi:hypothetical protein
MNNTFIRDSVSGALINTDVSAIEARRNQKRQTKQVVELQKEISEVKNDLLEIKQLLQSILADRG